MRVGGGEPCKHGVVITQAVCDLCLIEEDRDRLKRGEFTAEEIHDICHNLHGKVDARGFADGCAAEQRRLYGCAPDADQVTSLIAARSWQPIETAPKDGTVIIGALIRDGKVWRIHDMRHNGLAFYTVNGGSLPQMTHWTSMPLPEPPQ